ncbi:MAG: inactive transglutaminase family protein [Gammaproteobacteria bacterium]
MNPRQVYWLALALVIIALSISAYKIFVLKLPVKPDTTIDVWDVEVQITFTAQKRPVKVALYLPQNRGRFDVIDEHFISGEYGLAIQQFATNRKATWSQRYASGKQYLLYKVTLRRALSPNQSSASGKEPKVIPVPYSGASLVAATHIINSLRRHSADNETLVGQLLTQLSGNKRNENVALLLGNDHSPLNRAMLAVNLLAVAGIPAHVVHGVDLTTLQRNARRVHWLEVYYKNKWHDYNLVDGSQHIPDHYLAWWRDNKPLVTLEGGDKLYSKISVNLNPQLALQQHMFTGRKGQARLIEYSLLSLPIETQALFHVILMVPVGVIFLVLMRNLVGVKTFGTFMPILIALAFRETQLLWGIFLFVLVVSLGLSIRFYFDQLKLLLVPRLASVLIVVILLMAAISVLSFKLGLPRGLSIALFPMVILTMTIERMSIVWEERGSSEAVKQGLGSLFVASMAYVLMNLELLRHFIFVFPEMLLILLALSILLGRYSGYRLTELIRFKVLGEKH